MWVRVSGFPCQQCEERHQKGEKFRGVRVSVLLRLPPEDVQKGRALTPSALGLLLSVLIWPKDICLSKWIFSFCVQGFARAFTSRPPQKIQRSRARHMKWWVLHCVATQFKFPAEICCFAMECLCSDIKKTSEARNAEEGKHSNNQF